MLIPWPSKAEHGEKIQPDDDFVYGPVVFNSQEDGGSGWCTCDEGELCPYHSHYGYPPMEDLNT